jgi:hypothetical protein
MTHQLIGFELVFVRSRERYRYRTKFQLGLIKCYFFTRLYEHDIFLLAQITDFYISTFFEMRNFICNSLWLKAWTKYL